MDGGVHHDTAACIVRAGADILVAGSAVFEEGNARECAGRLFESALGAANEAGQEISTLAGGDGSDGRRSCSDDILWVRFPDHDRVALNGYDCALVSANSASVLDGRGDAGVEMSQATSGL